MFFDQDFINQLLGKAALSPRLRQHYDLRDSVSDTSQRMLNALLPGTDVPVHRHEDTSETVICLSGRVEEIFYEEVQDETGSMVFKEISHHLLAPQEGNYGIQIPAGVWHTIRAIEPSVIFEAKDGAYKG